MEPWQEEPDVPDGVETRLDRLGALMVGAAVAYAACQPLAPGPAQGAALVIIGLYLVALARREVRLTPVAWSVLAFLGCAVLASVRARFPLDSFDYAQKYWHFALVPAVAAIPRRTLRRRLPLLGRVAMASSGLAALSAFLELTARWSLKWDLLMPGQLDRDTWMLYGFFGHHMTFAGFLAVVTFSAAGLAVFGHPGVLRRAARVAAAVGGFLLLVARKRAYWIGSSVGLLLLAFRRSLKAGLLVVLLLGGTFLTGYALPGDFRDRIERAFVTEDNSQRIGFWMAGWEMFRERPVLGWGPGGYLLEGKPFLERVFTRRRIAHGWRDNFTHVHNLYLQLLVDGGAVLLGAYLVFMGLLVAKTGRDWRAAPAGGSVVAYGAGMFALLIALGVAGFFECNLMDKQVGLSAFFAVGLYLALRGEGAETSAGKAPERPPGPSRGQTC